jgi:hypothetical protein
MILRVFLSTKVFVELSMEYLVSISWKEFEGDHWRNICRIF